MKKSTVLTLALVLVLIAIAGYATYTLPATIASASAQPNGVALPPSPLAAPKFASLADLESAYENIYSQVSPSVVSIDVVESSSTTLPPNHPTTPNFPPSGIPQMAAGSGFVWDTQGNIVTNNHVVAGATQIDVTFSDGTTAAAKVVGTDPDSDLAVIKVSVPANQLHPIKAGDSTQVKVGQIAIAIGNPFSEQNTMTTGIISALGRSLPAGDRTTQGPTYSIPDVIQTDAPINPGNSGGVLLDAQGQLVGVTSAIESGSGSSSGIGFAIPSAIVQKVIPALITSGRFQHPYLGISGTTLTPTLAQAMGLKPEQRGALVVDLTVNGPAAKAGLRGSTQKTTVNGLQANIGGDVITSFEGQAVKSFDDLVAFLARNGQVGQPVTVTVLRDGNLQDVKITLTARPAQ
ncbi:MAG: S1C family serine protease [Acidobacteriota bacterium]